jgi:hypothetical protein
MERATKLLVLVWTAAALAAEIRLASSGWRELPLLAAGLFGVACALSAADWRGMVPVLALTYVLPFAVDLLAGRYVAQFSTLWMAGLLGAMLPAAIRTRWQIPAKWRAPLVCWALSVVVGASIVVAREFDFTIALLELSSVSNSVRGGWPSFTVTWILHVAVVTLVGILFFDWLCGASEEEFRRSVVAPLAVSFLVCGCAGVYQLVAEPTALNATAFGARGRAAGLLLDANVFGNAAALWLGAMLLVARRASGWRRALAAGGAALAALGVFASGSRTALAAAIIVTLFSSVALLAHRWDPRSPWTWVRLGGGAVAAALLVVALALAAPGRVGPLARVQRLLPDTSTSAVRSLVRQVMWVRNGYGLIAAEMIREFPLVGVGVGSFHIMSSDFFVQLGRGGIAPDNAQSWYRHQLAELGVLGSLGWIVWTVLFAAFVFRQQPSEPPDAWVPRGMIVAFAAVSLVGMPGQEAIAVVAFWAAARGYGWMVEAPQAWRRLPRTAWVAVAAVVLVFGAGTARVAATELRVPFRAARIGWPYAYGFYPPVPDGRGGEARWTAPRAVSVIETPPRWMALTVSVDHLALTSPHAAASPVVPTRPVVVRVWCDGQAVLDTELRDTRAITTYVRIPDGQTRVVLETRTSRALRPKELGLDDDRELGMLVSWRFVDRAPPDAPVEHLEPRRSPAETFW